MRLIFTSLALAFPMATVAAGLGHISMHSYLACAAFTLFSFACLYAVTTKFFGVR